MRIKDYSKKDRIHNAIIKLVNESGFEGLSMSKVASEANLSPATIYLYFSNKEDIVLSTFKFAQAELKSSIFKDFSTEMPLKEGFELILMNTLLEIIQNAYNFEYVENFLNSPLQRQIDNESKYDHLAKLFEVFNRGKERGVIKELDNYLLLAFSYYPIVLIANRHLSNEITLNEQMIKNSLEISWDAINY